MAVIAIVLSSALGFIAGVIHVTLLGGSVLQGVMTYGTVAVVGSAAGITLSLLRGTGARTLYAAVDDTAQWDEWHEQEDWHDAELEAHQSPLTPSQKRNSA